MGPSKYDVPNRDRFMSLLLSMLTAMAALQATSTTVDPLGAPVSQVRAARLPSAVALDGVLNEAAWGNAQALTRFVQLDPSEGALPSERTSVAVLFDDDAIYIGAELHETAPDSITARLARRDNQISTDRFTVFLDPYHDHRTGFYFGVSAAGTLYDGTLFNDDWDSDTWDGIWEARVARDPEGWTVEMRIPYSQLRFQQRPEQVWGINFKREIARRNERDYLVFTPKNGSGFVSRFVDLVGLDQVKPPARLELLPYVSSRMELVDHQPGDPFNDGSQLKAGVGADLKVGLGSNLTFDATVNPDFGQVEVDPAVVNLSDVETFYPEKRPFFIEGANIFDYGFGGANNFWGFNFPGPDLFYSRRIGRPPQGSVPSASYSDLPDGTTILGASKLSGKVGGGWNVGLLSAVTSQEKARLEGASGRFDAVVEPLSEYTVVRSQREFHEGRQGFGILGTGTFRRLGGTGLEDQLNQNALALGIDGWTFLDRNKMWVITGWAAATRVAGTAARISDLEQSATHYFQRPDADYVGVDSAATSLSGWAGRLWLNKQRGDWVVNAGLGAIRPGFESNDVGFMSRTDVINGHFVLTRRWSQPGRRFRSARLNTAVFRSYDFGGDRIGDGYWLSGGSEFLNYHGMEFFVAYNPERLANRQTRGGPLMLAPAGLETELDYNTDDRKSLIGRLSLHRSAYGQGSDNSWSVSGGVEWRPASAITLRLEPEVDRSRTTSQYVGTFADPTAGATYGNRYVFADLDQTTVSANVRLNWIFSPKLSLELFVQPLVSSGAYRRFKELAAPRSYAFNVFGQSGSTIAAQTDTAGNPIYVVDPDGGAAAASFSFDNPDFSLASLRGNAVLRWEYLPGSTLFLVWTQSRNDDSTDGDFRFGRSLHRLFGSHGNNIFAVKLTYWWNP